MGHVAGAASVSRVKQEVPQKSLERETDTLGDLSHAKPSGDGSGKPHKGNTEGVKLAFELVHPNHCVRSAWRGQRQQQGLRVMPPGRSLRMVPGSF